MGTVKSLFMQQLWMDTILQHWWERDRKQRETETTKEERHRLVVRWERAQVCWETKTPEEKRQRLADKKDLHRWRKEAESGDQAQLRRAKERERAWVRWAAEWITSRTKTPSPSIQSCIFIPLSCNPFLSSWTFSVNTHLISVFCSLTKQLTFSPNYLCT